MPGKHDSGQTHVGVGPHVGHQQIAQSASCWRAKSTSAALPAATVTEAGTLTTRHWMVHGKVPDAGMDV